jgi:hypothetical protein
VRSVGHDGGSSSGKAVAKVQAGSLPYKVNTLGNHFFMPSQDCYKDNSGEYATYSPDRAKQLLDGTVTGARRQPEGVSCAPTAAAVPGRASDTTHGGTRG